jgi:hypothetical protein
MSVNLNVYVNLICHNECYLLPHAIQHYKKYLPSCVITIYDNESDDNSVEIAKAAGCNVVSWSSGGILDEFKMTHLRNNCWKNITDGWIIMADMDEFVCITEKELMEETKKGVTILRIQGACMITDDDVNAELTNVDLQKLKIYEKCVNESKNLCFKRSDITDMNYGLGAHSCNPTGNIKYSEKVYFNKHMSPICLNYFVAKYQRRFTRSHDMRAQGIAIHYLNSLDEITKKYNYIRTLAKYTLQDDE